MKKKIYIVSADDIILYQPTILNLYDFLSTDFDVTIVTFEPAYLGNAKETEKQVIYISENKFIKKIARTVDLYINAVLKRLNKLLKDFTFRVYFVRSYHSTLLFNKVTAFKDEILIAVDSMPLVVCQKINNNVTFLSLEIIPNDVYLNKININKIGAVIIQNKERVDYLFKAQKPKVFYIQNSPQASYKTYPNQERKNLIWAGTLSINFGILYCLDFIEKYSTYHLCLKGAMVGDDKLTIEKKANHLIENNLVSIDNTYFKAKEFIEFIATFKIGFCFYSWDLINKNFNYQTAPSGKLFMYLAAGVPVIACNIIGFKFIEEFDAGILINDYLPETILAALQKIESNYSYYSSNAHKAFDATNFNINANDLKQYFYEKIFTV